MKVQGTDSEILSGWLRLGVVLVCFVFAAAGSAFGQGRAGGGTVGHVYGGHIASHAANHVATPLNPNFAPLRGVPGLGFDYEHLAAINGNRYGNRTFRNRSGRTFITPIFGWGVPYYYAFDTGEPYDELSGPALPSNAMMPPIPDTGEQTFAAPPIPPGPQIPPPELGQLILVLRDGQIVTAVAFTTSNGRLTYITQDGLRRSFPVAELDKDTTLQMNDVNGTSISLPD